VSVQVEAGLRAVVDPHAFDRIVSNLLVNAIRHGAPPVTLSATRTSEELVVTCEDRGAGVASDFVGSLFERFTRGATRSSEGAGLGLAIAQVYARAHGGAIHYEPAEPHGARFRLTLPIATDLIVF
jgi:two-component system sensor histidine kinase MtrB